MPMHCTALERVRALPFTRARGFTLIEVMITVVIVGILAAVALPAFMDQIRKSRRSDAINTLAQVQQAQERFRANNTTYGSKFSVDANGRMTGVTTTSTDPTSFTTSSGYYTIELSGAAAGTYTVTATATSTQARDSKCTALRIVVTGGNASYESTGSATANQCWDR